MHFGLQHHIYLKFASLWFYSKIGVIKKSKYI